jgi:hypothetical protein
MWSEDGFKYPLSALCSLFLRCHLMFMANKQKNLSATSALRPQRLLTYILPASSSSAHSDVTSQFPDVRKRGGTEGMAGWVPQEAERVDQETGTHSKPMHSVRYMCIQISPPLLLWIYIYIYIYIRAVS